jgi:hypothetical protein
MSLKLTLDNNILEELNLLTQIFNLHQVRNQMMHASIYHGVYEDMVIGLNQKLRAISGKNYIDYTLQEIDLAQRVLDSIVEKEV